jgi:guanylate kinase
MSGNSQTSIYLLNTKPKVMNTKNKISIDEIKQMLNPYMDIFELEINEDINYPFLIVNKDFNFCLSDVHTITEDETTLNIRSQSYSLHLFRKSRSIHSTSF